MYKFQTIEAISLVHFVCLTEKNHEEILGWNIFLHFFQVHKIERKDTQRGSCTSDDRLQLFPLQKF